MRKISLYSVMALVSMMVRQFVLPNPFECFGDKAALINWIAEPIMHLIVFGAVGIFYLKGVDESAFGSFLYLVFYALLTGILLLLSIFSFAWWWIIAILVITAIIISGLVWLKERFL